MANFIDTLSGKLKEKKEELRNQREKLMATIQVAFQDEFTRVIFDAVNDPRVTHVSIKFSDVRVSNKEKNIVFFGTLSTYAENNVLMARNFNVSVNVESLELVADTMQFSASGSTDEVAKRWDEPRIGMSDGTNYSLHEITGTDSNDIQIEL